MMLKGYDFGSQTYCEACALPGMEGVLLSPGEWFICGTCSFAIGLHERQELNMKKPAPPGTPGGK